MELKLIVRIAGTDLDGKKPVVIALQKIQGISYSFANAIARAAGVDIHEKLGALPDSKIKLIKKIIESPSEYIPHWILNRRKDYFTGKDVHLTGAELVMAKREDMTRVQRIKTWRGLRLAAGLKVRGQRTKASGRKGMAVGVKRKKVMPVRKKREK